jgi:predicted AlkP superfamily pyrophosphatase or phosphodiesterase
MRPLLVLDVVGLTPALLAHAPRIAAVARQGFAAPMRPVLPAVTCPAQSSMLTGLAPSGHGVVANGWYDRERAEVGFWKQSAHLVHGERVWDAAKARDPKFTSANVCWWFAMYGSGDFTVTPRPAYPADGRKIPDCWTHPADLRDRLQSQLGTFPLFSFWGPKAGITSTRWIAEAAKRVLAWHAPTAAFVYLPHLDYPLQKVGPAHASIPAEVAAVDAIAGDLVDAYRARGYGVVVLSEYGIAPVGGASFPNRTLRRAGLLALREDATGETLDHGASRAFAVPDHQLAHVYCRDAAAQSAAREALAADAGVDSILEGPAREAAGLSHPRSGEIVLLARSDRWFAHDWWEDDARAPDYQRTVDIHRKPGYDPRELFFAPGPLTPLRAAAKLAARKLGLRNLLDVIPLDASLVRGSHGLPPARPDDGPVLVCDDARFAPNDASQTDVKRLVLQLVFGDSPRLGDCPR